MNKLVGQPILRVEDERFLRGRGEYVDDLHFDHMLHAVVCRSPIAHGRILNIGLDEALKLPGVVRVFTYGDIASIAKPIPPRIAAMPNFESFLQLPFASDKVRYVGEPVALVVATDPYVAEDAAGLIEVEYEGMPAIVDWSAAREAGILIHEHAGTNISSYSVDRGDPDDAFANAPYRRSEKFSVHRHTAIPLECRGLIATWDVGRRRLRLYGATKIPFFNRGVLAHMLNLPLNSVELVVTDVGGSFGVRGEFYPEDFLIPFASIALNRPIKWIEDRAEHLLVSNHSRDVQCELEIACELDGTIIGLRGDVKVNLGAYARGTGGTVPSRIAQYLPGPYRVPHYSCHVEAFVSNTTPTGTYRGPGRYESNFFRERLLNIAAHELGIDPGDIRRRNLIRASEMPYSIGKLVTYEPPAEYDSGNFHSPLERALKEIDWSKKQELQGKLIDGKYHGVGLACFVESGAGGRKENARVRLGRDGKLDVYVGSASAGQGHETVLAQVCADAAGVALDQVRIHKGSTHELIEGFGTWHSRTAVMSGNAILKGTQQILELLKELAREYFGEPGGEVCWERGEFRLAAKSAPSNGPVATLEELATYAERVGKLVETLGTYDHGGKQPFSYGAGVAHVTVDPKSGRVAVLDYVAVEDVGRVINPLIAHGQVIGGIVQGLGGVLMEHLLFDKAGQFLTGSLADYRLPTASDFPNVRSICLEECPAPGNPLGAKGVGEGGIGPVAAVIGNAVAAALAPLNASIRDLPLSPPRVWQMIRESQPL